MHLVVHFFVLLFLSLSPSHTHPHTLALMRIISTCDSSVLLSGQECFKLRLREQKSFLHTNRLGEQLKYSNYNISCVDTHSIWNLEFEFNHYVEIITHT